MISRLYLKSHYLLVLSCLLFSSCRNQVELPEDVILAMAELSAPVDYTYDIKPILSDRCYACHGPDGNKLKANLRLDIEEVAYQKNPDSGQYAIVPGNPAESELVKRILSNDPEVIMPSPESHLSLTALEKAKLIKWIEEGAEYNPHWSLTKVERPKVPSVKNTEWAINEIDAFILHKMEQKGLQPSPEAEPTILLRRVYMDLTGLPPTTDEVKQFMADPSPLAYEKVVDRLLASPHYGEHMAVPWLDAARYADTHGYQDDMMRTAWPFRDWVIDAFNKNLTYDKFVTWQLAGDLVPAPNRETRVATAFNRMHPQSMEGGIISEEYRTEYVADRVGTFGTTFLGMTIECARCHDHKYDPISQKDYYSLFAFFNNINENGQIPYNGESSPSISLPTPEAENQLNFLRKNIQFEKKKLATPTTEQLQNFAGWLKNADKEPQKYTIKPRKDLYGRFTFDEATGKEFQNLAQPDHKGYAEGDDSLSNAAVRVGRFGKARYIYGENSVNFGENFAYFERNQPFTVSIWLNIHDAATDGSLIHKSNHITSGFRGWNVFRNQNGTIRLMLSHVWPDNSIELETIEKFPLNKWTHLAFSYDGLSKAAGVQLFIDGILAKVKIYNDNLTQSLLYGKNKTNITVNGLQIGRLNDRFTKNFEVDELRLYTRALTPLELRSLYSQRHEVVIALKVPADRRTPQQQQGLLAYYLTNIDSTYRQSTAKCLQWIGEETEILNAQIDVMVMKERKYPRKSYILNRGAYDAPTQEVTPDTPDQLFKIPAHYPKNRLGLAQWLVHENHPLFARVAVNRFWQQYFGQGLVLSSNDFGNQGSLPTHPALLDWLAAEFRQSDKAGVWNVKALQKLIVMSATYRQSSFSKENSEKDPDNTYYARGVSYRMSAEQIRDNALAASGLLTRRQGGPSVYPYQPKGIWEAISNYGKYRVQMGDTLYRRSMYTVWKRTAPPPMMLNFDASERHFCVIKRQKTSTPLQALVVMNDPQFVEAARVLAQRMLHKGTSPDEQISYAFMALTSRPPTSKELVILKELYQEEYQHFQRSPKLVSNIIQAGEYPIDHSVDAIALATCTVVASTVMNFDEFIIKR